MFDTTICASCHRMLQPEWFFCPHCGEPSKEQAQDISFLKQMFIYFVSFFLAPLGLIWGLKFLKSKDKKVNIVGVISSLLTVLSVVLMAVTLKIFMDQYTGTLLNLNNLQQINVNSINKLFQ